jgi:hypothetical protein
MSCPDCAREVDHCHGTLVVRTDGMVECCTDDGCVEVGRERHDLLIVVPAD